MKYIAKVKNYWNENKDEIVRKAEGITILACVYAFGSFVGFIAGENARDKAWKEDALQYARMREKAIGKHDENVYLLAINRDESQNFDKMLKQAASDGRLTDNNGVTHEVVGAIVYAGDEIKED